MNQRETLLVEILTEEMPASEVLVLGPEFAHQVSRVLTQQGFAHQGTRAFYTLRRLAVQLFQMPSQPAPKTVRKVGPAVVNLYDEQGNPTPAALGFAKSCGVELRQLATCEEKGIERLVHEVTLPGLGLNEVVGSVLNEVIKALPMKKRMRWLDEGGASRHGGFIRPVRGLCVLYGKKALAGYNVFTHEGGQTTIGHRFHGEDETVVLKHADDYETVLEQHGVVADFQKRCDWIRQQARESVTDAIVDMNEHRLWAMAATTEWPQLIRAEFDSRFLQLPKEVLSQVLTNSLKVLPILDKTRKQLLPQFVIVANIQSNNPETIKKGYEWVAHARFDDAMFFMQQDKKIAFISRQSLLADIVFQEQLGTLADKAKRLEQLVSTIALDCQADTAQTMMAAQLCKCDLTTDLVNEYPSLEGMVGGYYLADSGAVDDAVAVATVEHYRPRYAGDELPASPAGTALSIADKLDTLTGMFSVNHIPTGTKDPFGLRRAAIGIVRILVEKNIPLDLKVLTDSSLDLYPLAPDRVACQQKILMFVQERLRVYCLDKGFTFDCVDAVQAIGITCPMDFVQRLYALKQFVTLPEADNLTAANKRIINLLNKQEVLAGQVKPELLLEATEKNLSAQIKDCDTTLRPLLEQAQYLEGIQVLVQMHDAINQFFDQVLVMTDDLEQRNNRLALLCDISDLFMQIADFSKLQLQKG